MRVSTRAQSLDIKRMRWHGALDCRLAPTAALAAAPSCNLYSRGASKRACVAVNCDVVT